MTQSLYDAVSAIVSAAWRDGHTDFKGNLESYRQDLVGLLQGVSQETGGDVEYPAGAIHNGRASADQLESIYAFKEQGGHILSLCSEWQAFVQCFEHLVQSVDDHRAHVTRRTAENARLRAEVERRGRCYTTEKNLRREVQSAPPLPRISAQRRVNLRVTPKYET